ncbi:hypothetical protein HPB51_019924 [Rhipicephalus microplus]|uniref:Uncharacterized protein n=1 Tax=Rhipicephalus microplus TaxID=6941 RepID=A0A9J6EV20_RHIMP|nr:hypothetical protein HPB51_019924 [Rhipicephalus microplus]
MEARSTTAATWTKKQARRALRTFQDCRKSEAHAQQAQADQSPSRIEVEAPYLRRREILVTGKTTQTGAETVHVGGDHFKPPESSLEDDGVTRALT